MDDYISLIQYLHVIQYDDNLFDQVELEKIIKRIEEFSRSDHPKSLDEPCEVFYDNPPIVPDIDSNGYPVYCYIRCPRCFHRFHQDFIDDPVCEYCGQSWKL